MFCQSGTDYKLGSSITRYAPYCGSLKHVYFEWSAKGLASDPAQTVHNVAVAQVALRNQSSLGKQRRRLQSILAVLLRKSDSVLGADTDRNGCLHTNGSQELMLRYAVPTILRVWFDASGNA